MADWRRIAEHIGQASGTPFFPEKSQPIDGGCINTAMRLSDGGRRYFVKLNPSSRVSLFEAESAGLREIAATQTIRTPQPLCHGTAGGQAYLVMEYIPLTSLRAANAAAAGRALAAMHRSTRDRFGWNRNNSIGATHQPNHSCNDWVDFWREQRLGVQLQLAARNGYGGALQSQGEKLLTLFPALMDHRPAASLLHGDLWGGNMGQDKAGNPVIFDPAVYYGDREADIAMTELFGGFGADFYAGYEEGWPLNPGYPSRKTLYNLYHILNHLNLFGGAYLRQAQGMMNQLLAELA